MYKDLPTASKSMESNVLYAAHIWNVVHESSMIVFTKVNFECLTGNILNWSAQHLDQTQP